MEQNTKICPRCGGPVEEGFLQGSGRQLAFVKKYRWLKIQEEVDYLLPFSRLKGTYLPGQYCENCETLTISLKEEGKKI